MTPMTKATLASIGILLSFVTVPVVIVVLHNWLLVIAIAVTYSAVLYLFASEMYKVIRSEILKPMLEDQKVTAGFEGDPLKLHFYHGFAKYFRGDLSEQGLQHWLERHRPQI